MEKQEFLRIAYLRDGKFQDVLYDYYEFTAKDIKKAKEYIKGLRVEYDEYDKEDGCTSEHILCKQTVTYEPFIQS